MTIKSKLHNVKFSHLMGLKTGADWLEEKLKQHVLRSEGIHDLLSSSHRIESTTLDTKTAQGLPEVVPTALKKRRCSRGISRSSIRNAWWNFVSVFSATIGSPCQHERLREHGPEV